MSTGSTAILPIGTLDEDAWEDLLSYIEERRVIPIVGPELLQVATDRGPRQLLDWVAEKLAARLNVDRSDLPERYTLNDVVCLFLAGRGGPSSGSTAIFSRFRKGDTWRSDP